jgi:hypothetical protein
MHFVDEMETRHLFYTLRMIWNHSMPEEARSPSYKRYTFGAFYTPWYMGDAIRAIIPELQTRADLTSAWRAEIDRWEAYLASRKTGKISAKPETTYS